MTVSLAPIDIPRTLVIRILHAAQLAAPDEMHGWVYADAQGRPCAYRSAQQDMSVHKADQQLWARLWSVPQAAAVPAAAELRPHLINLLVSLSTRGVLELRAWSLVNGEAYEHALRLIDNGGDTR